MHRKILFFGGKYYFLGSTGHASVDLNSKWNLVRFVLNIVLIRHSFNRNVLWKPGKTPTVLGEKSIENVSISLCFVRIAFARKHIVGGDVKSHFYLFLIHSSALRNGIIGATEKCALINIWRPWFPFFFSLIRFTLSPFNFDPSFKFFLFPGTGSDSCKF